MKRVLDFEYLTGGSAVDGAHAGMPTLLPQDLAAHDATGLALQRRARSVGLPSRCTEAPAHVGA